MRLQMAERVGRSDDVIISRCQALFFVPEPNGWHQVDPSDAIREAAVRFLRVHPLRAADALQLAAAFVVAERRPAVTPTGHT